MIHRTTSIPEATAYHEAGHAVVGYMRGLGPASVGIGQISTSPGEWPGNVSLSRIERADILRISLAGPIAETRYHAWRLAAGDAGYDESVVHAGDMAEAALIAIGLILKGNGLPVSHPDWFPQVRCRVAGQEVTVGVSAGDLARDFNQAFGQSKESLTPIIRETCAAMSDAASRAIALLAESLLKSAPYVGPYSDASEFIRGAIGSGPPATAECIFYRLREDEVAEIFRMAGLPASWPPDRVARE